MTLSDLISRSFTACAFNTNGLARAVRLTRASGECVSIDALVEHRQVPEEDERGGLGLVEQIEVSVNRDDVEGGFARGESITLESGELPYLYAFEVRRDQWTYRAIFERVGRKAMTPNSARAGRARR